MKARIYITSLVFVLFLGHSVYAQLWVQRAMYSQYQFNGLAVNPAFSATEQQGRVTALTRHQWVGFDGAPQTQTISGYMTLPNEKTSVGAMFIHDKLGVDNEQAFFLSLAQRVQLSATGYLAAGFATGIGYYSEHFSELAEDDPGIINDPVFANDQSTWRSNLGLGLMYFDDRWDVGISVPYLAKFNLGSSSSSTSLKTLRSDYYVMASYRFKANDYIKLKPSVFLKHTSGVPLQFDVNMNAYIEEKGLWLGLGYRSMAAVMAMFQVKLNDKIQLGYSHDFMTNIRSKYQMGTHEIMLNYRFKGGKRPYNANDFRF